MLLSIQYLSVKEDEEPWSCMITYDHVIRLKKFTIKPTEILRSKIIKIWCLNNVIHQKDRKWTVASFNKFLRHNVKMFLS